MWYSRFNVFTRNSLPAFIAAKGLPDSRGIITRTLALAKEGNLQAVVEGPYDMTTKGVQQAFESLKNRHPHGKVVVKVADLPK
jgi:hypothetical protein